MKLLIVSDLHSNVEGIKAIYERESGVDVIYGAGDYTDYGPDPAATIDWVRSHGVHAVLGNHDETLLRVFSHNHYQEDRENGYTWAMHNCRKLVADAKCGGAAEGCDGSGAGGAKPMDTLVWDAELGREIPGRIAYLKSLPKFLSFTADGIAYLMTHRYGNRYEIVESKYQFDKFWEEHFDLPGCEGMERRMIFGHSHRQLIQILGEKELWLNPGSASYRRPDDPSKDAYYITITDGDIRFHHVSYLKESLMAEVNRTRGAMHVDETRVADFFFGWSEADGPDDHWIQYCKEGQPGGSILEYEKRMF